jgi:hypothetical protein
MFEEKRQHDPFRERAYLWRTVGTPLMAILVPWAMYLLCAAFGIDLIYLARRRASMEPTSPEYYLYGAIAATVLAIPFVIWQWRLAAHLAECGVEVVATILDVSAYGMYGVRKMNYEYTFEGETFRKAMTCESSAAVEYLEGRRKLVLLCDPAKPKRCMELADVFRVEQVDAE